MILVDQLVIILTSCVVAFSELEAKKEGLEKAEIRLGPVSEEKLYIRVIVEREYEEVVEEGLRTGSYKYVV